MALELTCHEWRQKYKHACKWAGADNHFHVDSDSDVPEKAKHFDENKLALQNILAMPGLDEVAKVGMYGAKKYGQWNYRGGSEYMRYLGSAVRHVTCYIRGESNDAESGLPHLAHCIYNLLIVLGWELDGVGTDDRPRRASNKVVDSGNSLPF